MNSIGLGTDTLIQIGVFGKIFTTMSFKDENPFLQKTMKTKYTLFFIILGLLTVNEISWAKPRANFAPQTISCSYSSQQLVCSGFDQQLLTASLEEGPPPQKEKTIYHFVKATAEDPSSPLLVYHYQDASQQSWISLIPLYDGVKPFARFRTWVYHSPPLYGAYYYTCTTGVAVECPYTNTPF
ncbi:hypothetical protein CbuD7D7780_08635 [Coxiella burnetii]|uniref:Hypothetical membrane spanning protein n=1 Tax=Coxiella burnetii (strain Dugway 5J108-111) TaxID=434922 RepID=A9KEI6_COXBN|nr:hypothetical protein [Coxiella burnetii]ABS76612.1 hypothetical membrane spanning protein [Coxiella burnetii Dugway 5J108-111]OYK79956.1 hypothetical protein CbuD7E6568_08620 [Coxiella burnetii]OYK82038.1 hypothetical protein CbuD7D7780_08635 [Coxiella burnetii]